MGITGPAFEWIQVDGNKKLTISRLFSKILGEPHRCSISTRHQVYEKEQLYKKKILWVTLSNCITQQSHLLTYYFSNIWFEISCILKSFRFYPVWNFNNSTKMFAFA